MNLSNLKEKLDMLVKYECIDAPTTSQERLCWRMYTAEKIANYLGVRDLALAFNLPFQEIAEGKTDRVFGTIAKMLN